MAKAGPLVAAIDTKIAGILEGWMVVVARLGWRLEADAVTTHRCSSLTRGGLNVENYLRNTHWRVSVGAGEDSWAGSGGDGRAAHLPLPKCDRLAFSGTKRLHFGTGQTGGWEVVEAGSTGRV